MDHRTLLRKYERELRRLRAELQQKSRDLVDKRLVLQVRPRGNCHLEVSQGCWPACQGAVLLWCCAARNQRMPGVKGGG